MTWISGDGKSSCSISRMSAAWSAKLAWPSSSQPGKPPPMSSSFGAKPCCSASSKALRARFSALRKAPTCEQPLPTWKLTPTTFMPRALACASSSAQSSGAQPNLLDSGHWAKESSVCMRSTSSASGQSSRSFRSSALVSKVVRRTPLPRAHVTADACLQGWA